jgi:dTDP-4-dehydrorhamnose reductase
MNRMKVLILGASGMLGNALFKYLSKEPDIEAYGTVRHLDALDYFQLDAKSRLMTGIHAEDFHSVEKVVASVKPAVVINCIGLVKQLSAGNDPQRAMPINAEFPHQLSHLCKTAASRFLHISTDCVFSGSKGNYSESDIADATDIYGRSKLLGEVNDSNSLTLRTSIIGHELTGNRSLVGWFLAQEGEVRGFSRAIFSGLPTVELSRVIKEIIIKHPALSGIYHVASEPINKYELLRLLAEQYGKSISIIEDDSLVVDKSLDPTRFFHATGYKAPIWPVLIQRMHEFEYSLDEALA